MLKQQLEQDLKTALLAGDKARALTLRSLKSAILNVEVAKGLRDTGLPDDEILTIFAKESKKRQESADLYVQGERPEKADAELAEKAIIDIYLPAALSDEALITLVETTITELGASGPGAMGQVIGTVKQKAGNSADGARIAQLVKERL